MERDHKGRLPWTIVLLVVAISCAVAFSGAFIYTKLSDSNTFTRYRAVQVTSLQKLEAVNDGFVYYDGNTLAKIGTDTKNKWNTLVGPGVDFSATDNGVATWSGKTLTMLNLRTGETEFSGNLDADVLSAHIGQSYTAALIGPEHNSTIVLMEKGGQKIDSITLADQTVIDYGFFSSNGSLFWVMTLDTSGTVPNCTISTYNPGRRIVGSITDNEQVMYQVMFQSSQICSAGDTYLKVYDYTGKEDVSRRKLIYGWYLADEDEESDNPMMAFAANGQYSGGSQIKDVRMIRGNLDQIVRMPFACTSLIAKGNRVFGFSTDGYVMVAELGQRNVNAYRLPIQVDRVYGVTGESTAIVGNGSIVYFVSLL